MAIESHAPPAAQELLRYFSVGNRGLLSVRNDGSTHILRASSDWKLFLKKTPELDFGTWLELKHKQVAREPLWATTITELPSLSELEEWLTDSVCETPTGHIVEPDGVGPDGVPSWLRCLGMI